MFIKILKNKFLSLITHPHDVPTPLDFKDLSLKHTQMKIF